MNSILQLTIKNLRHFHKAHLLTLLGVSIAIAILVGALMIADSLDYTLVRIAETRLGHVQYSLEAQDRFLRADLAQAISDSLGVSASAMLSLQAFAFADNDRQPFQAALWGVDEKFWQLANEPPELDALGQDQAVINNALAKRLSLRAGDVLVVRFAKKRLLPAELPLAREQNAAVALRVTVKSIVPDQSFGRFSLQATQRVPYNIFLSRSVLAKELDVPGLCNTILAGGPADLQELQNVLEKKKQLPDFALQQRPVPGTKQWEWISQRIFIEEKICNAVAAEPVLSYFVNSLQRGDRTTPYSFVSTAVPENLKLQDGQILITRWLADDLHATAGDSLTLTWFSLNEYSQLIERATKLQVRRALTPEESPDATLMPELPGLADAQNCRDWHPGLPLDLKKIRTKDEQYWQRYRGAPKALVSLATGQKLWANRFGNCTALRFPDSSAAVAAQQKLHNNLTLSQFGLHFHPIKQQALQASGSITDFSQLFIGQSFFVILSALLLIGLLFQIHLVMRQPEMVLYSALGFNRSLIQNLFLLEGALLGLPALIVGPCLGIAYVHIMLLGLKTWWSAAFSVPDLVLHVRLSSLLVATGAGYFLSLAIILWRCKRLNVMQPLAAGSHRTRHSRLWWLAAILGWSAGFAVMLFGDRQSSESATLSFFASGLLLVLGSLLACRAWLMQQAMRHLSFLHKVRQLALRNLARRPGRSLAVITLWAAAVFLILAVGSNRKSMPDTHERGSGSGGFSLWMETTAPLVDDLNDVSVRKKYGFTDSLWQKVSFFSMRLRSGDDASCLNLNRSLQPPLLGVDAHRLDSLQAFSFIKKCPDIKNPWQSLASEAGGTIPGIADQTVLQWGLGKAVGDTLVFLNESGQRFNVRLIAGLANSVFQGHLLIAQTAFLHHFPSQPGYRLFLVDAPTDLLEPVRNRLQDAMSDLGAEATSTGERLAQFNEIENTYLSIFLMLGGLALLLGSVGMGIVAVRNIHEQRSELGALAAMGFSQGLIGRLLNIEHGLLFMTGLLIGALAALLGLWPMIKNNQSEFPVITVLLLLMAIIAGGLMCIRYSVRKNLVNNISAILKNE